jgi:hypothetical protein
VLQVSPFSSLRTPSYPFVLTRGLHRDNKTTPLNCREQAEKFKEAVAGVEKVRLFFLPLSFFLISLSRLAHSHSHSPQAFFASAAVN